jgi:hypothetical protein
MKNKIIILGVVVATISTLVITGAQAQEQSHDQAKVSVYSPEQDVIKVIFGYDTEKTVAVNFVTTDGLFQSDIVSGKTFKGGFLRRYHVEKLRGKPFWIEISSPEMSVTFKMTELKSGKWAAHLEKTTYINQLVAKN